LPRCLLQAPAAPHQRLGQSILGVVGLPAEQPLWAQAPVVHPVLATPPNADDAPVGDGYVQAAAVRTEQASRRDPALDVVLDDPIRERDVDPRRPLFPQAMRGPPPPRVGDPLRSPADCPFHAQDARRCRSRSLPCSSPLRLVACARRKNSARSESPSRSASSM